MPEELVLSAAKPILDYGILGAIVIFFGWYIVTQNRIHKAEMKEERDAHQKTREAHIKAMEAGFGLNADIKDAVAAMKETGDQWIEFAKTVHRTGDRR